MGNRRRKNLTGNILFGFYRFPLIPSSRALHEIYLGLGISVKNAKV
jgi:hypothetical protein